MEIMISSSQISGHILNLVVLNVAERRFSTHSLFLFLSIVVDGLQPYVLKAALRVGVQHSHMKRLFLNLITAVGFADITGPVEGLHADGIDALGKICQRLVCFVEATGVLCQRLAAYGLKRGTFPARCHVAPVE